MKLLVINCGSSSIKYEVFEKRQSIISNYFGIIRRHIFQVRLQWKF
jgi:acetate kinase